MRRPTMQDIADELKISRNTVSRAIRDKHDVSQTTKEEVKKVANRIGYKYNKTIARDKNILEFKLIASSFTLSQTSFFGTLVKEMENKIMIEGDSLEIIEVSLGEEENMEMTLEQLTSNSKKIDGIFVLSHITDEFIQKIIDIGIPTVLIDYHSPQLLTDSVLTENEYGAYELVEYLLHQNLTRIGFIGNIDLSPSYYERYMGYKKVLMDHNLNIEKEITLVNVKEEQTFLFSELQKIEKMPEAWFCVNSGLAFILNTYLQAKGYSVPRDVSIVCFDDTEFSRSATPPITCAAPNLKYYVENAYELINKRRDDQNKPYTQIRVIPHLFERESVCRR